MYFDTHAHYDDDAFDADRDELIALLPESEVALVLNPGCDRTSSEKAMELARVYPYFYAAAGWHPHDAKLFEEQGAEDFLFSAIEYEKVVAIGEIGLDFHYDYSAHDIQTRVFERQMEFARDHDIPVIIHSREAHEETMKIVRRFKDTVRGVFHCYSGSEEASHEILDMGWYLSFTGAVTFKNARRPVETVAAMPLDRLMLETDSPYMTPVPHRGKRCDSRMLHYMAEKIGEIRGMEVEEIAALTMENGKRFFGIE